jgi:hypothetical protein
MMRRATLEPWVWGALLACLCVALGLVPDWRAGLGRFQVIYVLAFVPYAVAVGRRTRWGALRAPWLALLLPALLMRLAVLGQPPTLSDDLWRYLWEGRVVVAGHDPYALAPAAPELAALRDALVHPRVNHPSIAAIYPPLAQVGFALVAWVHGGVGAWKAWVLLHDLALCVALAWWCTRRGGSPWDALVYAWNPLVIVEYAGSGHHDPTGLLWMVLALAWARGRPVASALATSAAVLVKLVALPLVPLLWRDWTSRARLVASAVLSVALGCYVWASRGVDSGLRAFSSRWRHDDALFGPLVSSLGGPLTRGVVVLVLVALVGWLVLRRVAPAQAMRLGLRTGLLLGPVVHPWYLGWVIALEPLAPSAAWLALSCTVTLGYGVFAPPLEGGSYHPGVWVRVVEFGVPALVAVGVLLGRRIRGRSDARTHPTSGGA